VASALVNTTQQVGGSLGTPLFNTVAASATAGFIVAHGRGSVAAGTVHGFAVAFALGVGFLDPAAIVSAVVFTAHGDDLPGTVVVPSGTGDPAPA
jgi:hypothetical protein